MSVGRGEEQISSTIVVSQSFAVSFYSLYVIFFFLIILSFHHGDDEFLISHRIICIMSGDLERAEADNGVEK